MKKGKYQRLISSNEFGMHKVLSEAIRLEASRRHVTVGGDVGIEHFAYLDTCQIVVHSYRQVGTSLECNIEYFDPDCKWKDRFMSRVLIG